MGSLDVFAKLLIDREMTASIVSPRRTAIYPTMAFLTVTRPEQHCCYFCLPLLAAKSLHISYKAFSRNCGPKE